MSISKKETFTFTFLYKDDDEKVILITHGEEPAKDESEADTCLSSKNEDEKEAVEKIISKITAFKDAEPGCEESITCSLEDLEDKYDISLEDMDDVGETDGNSSEEKSEKSEKEDDKEEKGEQSDEVSDKSGEPAFISIQLLTDPMAGLPISKGVRGHLTDPISYLDELDDIENDYYEGYEPFQFSDKECDEDYEEQPLTEGASLHELISKFLQLVKASAKDFLTASDVTEIFNNLQVTNSDAKYQALNTMLGVSRAMELFNIPNVGPALTLKGVSVEVLPSGSKPLGIEDSLAKQAISMLAGTI